MKSQLRIVHLGKYYPPARGGIESHTQTLARAQAALGADVRVVVVNHADTTGRDVTFDRLARTPTAAGSDGPIRVTRVGRWANLAKLDVAPGLSAALRRLLKDPPDVWHLHTPNPAMMFAALVEPRVRPLVVTHHSDIVRQKILRHVVRPIEASIYRRAALVFSDSPTYVDGSTVLQRLGAKARTLPLGLDLASYRNPTADARAHAYRLRARFGPTIWLCVGRLIYYKGLHVALQALRDVPGHLLVVGTGPLETALKADADACGVAGRVTWLGSASPDELTGAYLAATALWFPSVARSEGFGLVQVEAMASGCPVVNTAIVGSGVPWVCRHDQEGLTAPVGDPAAFAAAANRLLNEPGLRDRLAANGRARAAAEFDWMTMGRRSLDLYQSAILAIPTP